MSQNGTPERFAYGDNSIDGCPCPVLATGREMGGDLVDLAETYDRFAMAETGEDEGTVSRDVARGAWQATVDEWREMRDEHGRESEMWEFYNSIASEAEEIRIELFE